MADRLSLRGITWPTGLLLVAVLASVILRAAWISAPCRAPCRTASDHVLIFDETYYVGAARVIEGLAPLSGQHYGGAPTGDDPNSEHPQLVKLLIAGSIRVFGDGPAAWRLLSLIAGTLAILGMFTLVRAAGGSREGAAIAAALMAADNLLLVHGRIATLDAPAVAAMVWAVALYLRGRVAPAAVVLALGACCKLVALYALPVVALLELVRVPHLREEVRRVLARLGRLVTLCTASTVAWLAVLDLIAPPYDPGSGRRVSGGVFGHLGHMLSYASRQVSPHGPQGVASLPWGWPLDLGAITYLNIDPARPAPGLVNIHPAVHFLGAINPAILLFGLAGMLLVWRRRRAGALPLAPLWFLGTFLPFGALSLVWQRTSYLYYMVIVMPGLYAGAGELALALSRRHQRWVLAWTAMVLAALVGLYPFTPLP